MDRRELPALRLETIDRIADSEPVSARWLAMEMQLPLSEVAGHLMVLKREGRIKVVTTRRFGGSLTPLYGCA
jgi:hypothetical protein